MIIDTASLDARSSYKLLIGSVLPRAIAWGSTRSTAGIGNVAPVSFFTVVGRLPPIVSISLQPRSDEVYMRLNALERRADVSDEVVKQVRAEGHKRGAQMDEVLDRVTALRTTVRNAAWGLAFLGTLTGIVVAVVK